MLAGGADRDPTEVFDATGATVREPERLAPTRQLTVPVHEPAREPFVQPPPPRDPAEHRPRLVPEGTMRTGTTARLQRGAMLSGAFVGVAAGFTTAPYIAFLALGAAALAVRTWSWTTQSARERQHLRGRRRWFDAPLTVATTPWYLLVAAGGTAMLLLWAGLVTLFVGLGTAMLAPSTKVVLVVAGAVLALTTWWGPGGRRLRIPVRRASAALTRDPWMGWTAVAGVAIVTLPLAWLALSGDVSWAPLPGPPWREGTMLGRLVAWI
jgi:hypothetical protein